MHDVMLMSYAHWKRVGLRCSLLRSCICAALVLGSTLAVGQQGPPVFGSNPHDAHAHDSGTGAAGFQPVTRPGDSAAETQAIISVRYHCGTDPVVGGEPNQCEITVGKAEFDALVQALDPGMPASARQSLATEYSRLLIMAAEARRRGVDRSAEFQTLIEFSTLQLLASRFVRDIESHSPQLSAHELEQYFADHRREYREVSFSRISIPNTASHRGVAASARAEALRSRALRGEDFGELQREAAVAVATATPNVRIGPTLCLSLPQSHRDACDLKPGEISRVFTDNLGHFIYRLESRRDRTLDEAQNEIRARVERERLQTQIERFRTPVSLKLDNEYFGELPQPHLATQHGIHFPAVETTSASEPVHCHQD